MQRNVSAFIFFTDISSIISTFEKYTASQNQPSQDMQAYSGTQKVLPRDRRYFLSSESHLHEDRQKSWFLIIVWAETLESMVQSWKLQSPLGL